MRKLSQWTPIILLVAIFVFSGCSKTEETVDTPPPVINPDPPVVDPPVDPPPTTDQLQCSLEVPGGVVVPANTDVTILVNASGGTSPYLAAGMTSFFASQGTLTRNYSNTTDGILAVTETIGLIDSLAQLTNCTTSLLVLPSSSSDPGVTFVVGPSPEEVIGTDITISTFTTNFGTSPTITFTYSEAGVSMSQAESSATFSVTDGNPHAFDVTILASDGSDSASTSVSLSFVEVVPDPIICTISHNDGLHLVGDEVLYTVTANSGEALEITSVDPGTDGTLTDLTGSVATVTYSSSGDKTATVSARSTSTGAECNTLTHTVEVLEILSCEAFTQYSSYYTGETIWTWAIIPDEIGDEGIQVTLVEAIGNIPEGWGEYFLYPWFPLHAEVYFYASGTTTLRLTVEDANGQTATCTTDSFNVW